MPMPVRGGGLGGAMGMAKMFMAQRSATSGLGAAALKYGGTNR